MNEARVLLVGAGAMGGVTATKMSFSKKPSPRSPSAPGVTT